MPAWALLVLFWFMTIKCQCRIDNNYYFVYVHVHTGSIPLQCRESEVRLVIGSVPNEGRVKICVDSVWDRVCDDSWANNETRVVCRQLGYRMDGR